MSESESILVGVQFPKSPAKARAMLAKIKTLISKGHRTFVTRTARCLNNVESPGPDEAPLGYKHAGFWHDCPKSEEKKGEYADILLFSKK